MSAILSIKKFSEIIGVSPTTVSRVLNGKTIQYRISEKTKEKVLEAAAKYNVKPNLIAKQLKLKKTNTIGLIVPDISNPFFADLAYSIESELKKHDKMVILCNTDGDILVEKEVLQNLLARQVDALIIAPIGIEYSHLSSIKDTPVILVDRHFPDSDIPFLCTDNYQGAMMATEHLIKNGHQKIIAIQGIKGTSVNIQRKAGFMDAVKSHEIDSPIIQGNDFTIKNGYDCFHSIINKGIKFSAIFSFSSQITTGILKAAAELSLAIPEDFSLISFDDLPYLEIVNPPISTIKQPVIEIGKKAGKYIIGSIHNEGLNFGFIDPILIQRGSVKTLNKL